MKLIFGIFLTTAMLLACSGNKTKPVTNEPGKDTVQTDSVGETRNSDSLKRNSPEFGVFISYFLNTCYYNNNIDSLIYYSSTVLYNFFNKEAGFARYYNMGAFCNLYKAGQFGYNNAPVSITTYRERYRYSELAHYNKKPVYGFCEESTFPDGVYYYNVDGFPDTWDMERDIAIKVKLPAKFDKVPVMKVDILYEKWIAKKFFFAQINTIWYLVFVDDCDCSV